MKNFANRTDEELALLYAGGDDSAFDELLARNEQKLFGYIMFVVHDEHVANDIFQDTFVKAIVKLRDGKYTDSGKFLFWLTRIAHNVIMDLYRREKSERIVDVNEQNDLSQLHGASLSALSRENEVVNSQVLADVHQIMNALPVAQREVVYMRFYQNMSFKEIAESTGVSINTSLGRMRYAVINMRRMAKQNRISLNLEL